MATPKKPSPASSMFNAEFLSQFTGGTNSPTPVPGNGFTPLKARASLASVKDLAPTGLPAAVRPTKKVGLQRNLTADGLSLGTGSAVEKVEPAKAAIPTLRASLGDRIKKTASNAGKAISKVASSVRPEYLSNIANEITGPTGPRSPQLMGTTPSIPKVNMDATRAAIAASESAIGRSADQSVDANTGNAIRLGARAQTLTALNTTAEQEARANVGVAQANQQTDTQRRYVDTMTINKYQDDLQEFGNVRKSQRLANLSNFADKVVSRENLDRTEALDKEKFAVMKSMFTPGVSDRAYTAAQEALKGINTKSKFRKGGKLKMYAI